MKGAARRKLERIDGSSGWTVRVGVLVLCRLMAEWFNGWLGRLFDS